MTPVVQSHNMKRKGGEQGSTGEAKPISPFQQAVNGVNSAFVGEYDGQALRASVSTLTKVMATGLKRGDVPELIKRYTMVTTLASQASVFAREHDDATSADNLELRAEGLQAVVDSLKFQADAPVPQEVHMHYGK